MAVDQRKSVPGTTGTSGVASPNAVRAPASGDTARTTAPGVGSTVALGGAALLVAVALLAATVLSFTGLPTVPGAGGAGVAGRACPAVPVDRNDLRAGLTVEQASNAAIILSTGRRLGVAPYGWTVAVAAALRASGLVNRTAATGDEARGLFGQRPSRGWGSADQLVDPGYAAGAFFQALLGLDGWQRMTVQQAAHAVDGATDVDEGSAARAATVVAGYAGAKPGTDPACDPVTVSQTGWSRPVPGEVINRFRTSDLPNHQGIDLDASRNTVVRAAADGRVVTVLCNIDGRFHQADHTPSPCDTDGSPETGGCGWYLEIRHADDVVTRYCHLVRAPAVGVGQTVSAGQPIGLAGTSGHSSAVHLHFEIHQGYPAEARNATDPVPFLAGRGVVLCAGCASR